jgi:hypothetical protein
MSANSSIRDRVRNLTFKHDLERIDAKTREAIRRYSNQSAAAVTQRLAELDREWPVERALMTGVGFFVWLGLVLGTFVKRRLYMVSALAGAVILVYAFIGWAPPVMILRRLGVRTRGEIDQERNTLKALRGDFDAVSEGQPDPETRIDRALQAAS